MPYGDVFFVASSFCMLELISVSAAPAPIDLPLVSGSFKDAIAVITLVTRSMEPVHDSDALLIRNGLADPPNRAIAFAALCPVVRISVVKISAVDTQVVQLALIKAMRARNPAMIKLARLALLFAKKHSAQTMQPPRVYETACVGIRPTRSMRQRTMVVPAISEHALARMAP